MNTTEMVKRVIAYTDWWWENNLKWYFGSEKWEQWEREEQ